jgi:pimeloyl-ACP methyl ester carboxylesterase
MNEEEPKPPTPLPALEYTVEAPAGQNPRKLHTVVLLHGFPDNANVWNETQAHLIERGYRVVRIHLPGFERETQSRVCPTFNNVIDRLYRTLQRADALGGTLVGHDWGAIFAYRLLMKYPAAASRLVTLEIGAGAKSPLLVLFVLLYQSLIIAAYYLGPHIGSRLLAGFCRLFPRPSYEGALKVQSHHGWLYRQAWREGASDGPWIFYYRNSIAKWTPGPELPVLFLYGESSLPAFRFHTPAWRKRITEPHHESRSRGLPGNHWFFLENPASFQAELDQFLPPV